MDGENHGSNPNLKWMIWGEKNYFWVDTHFHVRYTTGTCWQDDVDFLPGNDQVIGTKFTELTDLIWKKSHRNFHGKTIPKTKNHLDVPGS